MKRQAGFTLIELAVVVFIIGMIAAMGLGAIKAQMLNASIRATQSNQGAIKDALMAYLAKNKRLPCPAVNNQGAEGRDTTVVPPNCFTYYGLVPYAEIGLTKNVAMDGWDDLFSYDVTPRWTATYNATSPDNKYSTATAAISFNVGVPGAITVSDRDQTTDAALPAFTLAAAVIVSHGANGLGAYTAKGTQNDASAAGADEASNIILTGLTSLTSAMTPVPTSLLAYKRDYTTNASAKHGTFDDVVMALNPNDLLVPLIKDGAMQSAQSQYTSLIASIQDYVASYIANHSCGTPPIADSTIKSFVDPWGNTLNAPGSLFTYITGGTFSSSVAATYTLVDTTPSATPASVAPSGATMIRIYPFLNNGC